MNIIKIKLDTGHHSWNVRSNFCAHIVEYGEMDGYVINNVQLRQTIGENVINPHLA